MKRTRNNTRYKQWKTISIVCFCILFSFFIYTFLILKPGNNQNWDNGYEKLPHFTITTSEIRIRNIRDYQYAPGKIVKKNYVDKTFHLSNLEKVWFVYEPFSSFKQLPILILFLILLMKDQLQLMQKLGEKKENHIAH